MTEPIRPGQLEPNEFERAILERLARETPALAAAIGKLHVLSREYTGVGSFTNFACDTAEGVPSAHFVLPALIHMPGVPNGMGAALFCKDRKPECLEIFAYGDDHWDGVHHGFRIE